MDRDKSKNGTVLLQWGLLLAISASFGALTVICAYYFDSGAFYGLTQLANRLLLHKYIVLFFGVSFLTTLLILVKFDLLAKIRLLIIKDTAKRLIFNLSNITIAILSLASGKIIISQWWQRVYEIDGIVPSLKSVFLTCGVWLLALPALFILWQIVIKTVQNFWKRMNFSKNEKRLLLYGEVIAIIINIIIFIFVSTMIANGTDRIYNMDSGFRVANSGNYNILDVSAHPFENLIDAPAMFVAKICASMFGQSLFLPLVMISWADFLILIMSIMLKRLLGISSKLKSSAWYILFLSALPTLLFAFSFESYVQGAFFVVAFLYFIKNNFSKKWQIGALLCAFGMISVGALAFLFFLLDKDNRSLRKMGQLAWKCLLSVIAMFIISGSLLGVLDTKSLLYVRTKEYAKPKGYTLINTGKQYSNFLAMTLGLDYKSVQQDITVNGLKKSYAGNWVTDISGNLVKFLPRQEHIDECRADGFSRPLICPILFYSDDQATQRFNPFGIIIGVMCIFGFVIGRKKMIVQASFGWLIFSYLYLGVFGQNSFTNEMTLDIFYFAWSLFVLLWQVTDWLFNKIKLSSLNLKKVIFISCFVLLGLFNIRQYAKIINFAYTYYPNDAKEIIIDIIKH